MPTLTSWYSTSREAVGAPTEDQPGGRGVLQWTYAFPDAMMRFLPAAVGPDVYDEIETIGDADEPWVQVFSDAATAGLADVDPDRGPELVALLVEDLGCKTVDAASLLTELIHMASQARDRGERLCVWVSP